MIMLFHRIMYYYRLIMNRTGTASYLFIKDRSQFPFKIFHPWAYICPGYLEQTPVYITDIVHTVQHKHLTIQKIMDIPANTPTKITFFDRNYIKLAEDNPIGIPIPAREALRHGYSGTFTRTSDTNGGTMLWSWKGAHEEDWEWDILIDNDRWYPIKYIKELNYSTWRELDPNTKIGWRGPSVLDSDIDSFPSIIINKNDQDIVTIPCDGTWRRPLSTGATGILRATLTKRMRELEIEIDALRTPPKRRLAIACEMLEDEVNEEIRQMYIELRDD